MSAIPTDFNGYISVTDRPISKVGVFPYLGASIGAPIPDKIYYVYRPANELSNEETINSFKLVPLIDEHEMLGDDATPAESKGVQGTLGENIYFKDNTLYGNIKVYSEAMKNLIEGGKKELSLGYKCKYLFEEGEYNGQKYDAIQTNLRGNHVALVQEGRMGKEVSVVDSAEKLTVSFDHKDFILNEELQVTKEELQAVLDEALKPINEKVNALDEAMKKSEDEETKKKGEDVEIEINKEEEKGEDAKTYDEMKKEYDEMKSQCDEMKKQLDEMKKENKAMDANDIKKSIMQEVAKKTRLADELSKHVGSFDHLDMDLKQVIDYGLNKLELNADKGQEEATLNGYLAGAKNSIVANGMDRKEDTKVSINNPLSVF